MTQTRRELAVAAKAEASDRFAPAFGASDYVRDRLDPAKKALGVASSEALQKRREKAQAEHFKSSESR